MFLPLLLLNFKSEAGAQDTLKTDGTSLNNSLSTGTKNDTVQILSVDDVDDDDDEDGDVVKLDFLPQRTVTYRR